MFENICKILLWDKWMKWSMMFLLNPKTKFNRANINEVKYTSEVSFNTS
jgi:hypothetical protein